MGDFRFQIDGQVVHLIGGTCGFGLLPLAFVLWPSCVVDQYVSKCKTQAQSTKPKTQSTKPKPLKWVIEFANLLSEIFNTEPHPILLRISFK